MRFTIPALFLFALTSPAAADDTADLKKLLETPILSPRQTLTELQEYLDAKIPRLPEATTAEAWEKETARLQKEVLEKVVFRGEAARWKDAKTRVDYTETFAGEGYSVKKLRYEIIPGFWVPALLYLPKKLGEKAPVMLAVNGHDRAGKAAGYKQTRCINLAKRGVMVLNVEWLGMGQLNLPANQHGAMDQLNLCGTSGLSLFYLNMTRGLDLLLAHPNADPKRVAVSGLSGGGWQTIFVSGLDPRVTLSNPVAGYSSFRTRIQHFKDLGDSEQTPCDLATLVDYTHLTAMRAPRPTLLTFNAKDNCCFESGYALPPLERASRPFFKLFGKENNLRTHINEVPGDHNFGQDNREALYKMIGDHFFPNDKSYSAKEIACKTEMKTPAELSVELPKDNLTINAVAMRLAEKVRKEPLFPIDRANVDERLVELQKELRSIVKTPEWGFKLKLPPQPKRSISKYESAVWDLKVGPMRVPVLEIMPLEKPIGTVIVLADGGRVAALTEIEALLNARIRVLAIDVYYFGEMQLPSHGSLWTLMPATVGDRALGIQAAQLEEVARLAWDKFGEKEAAKAVAVVAIGPRTSTIALVAAATGPKTISAVILHEPLASLKEIIETNRSVSSTPELFCFGLLEKFDVADLAALVAPRPVVVKKPSDRAKKEFAKLAAWYKVLGKNFDPLK